MRGVGMSGDWMLNSDVVSQLWTRVFVGGGGRGTSDGLDDSLSRTDTTDDKETSDGPADIAGEVVRVDVTVVEGVIGSGPNGKTAAIEVPGEAVHMRGVDEWLVDAGSGSVVRVR